MGRIPSLAVRPRGPRRVGAFVPGPYSPGYSDSSIGGWWTTWTVGGDDDLVRRRQSRRRTAVAAAADADRWNRSARWPGISEMRHCRHPPLLLAAMGSDPNKIRHSSQNH